MLMLLMMMMSLHAKRHAQVSSLELYAKLLGRLADPALGADA